MQFCTFFAQKQAKNPKFPWFYPNFRDFKNPAKNFRDFKEPLKCMSFIKLSKKRDLKNKYVV